jgi:hypothetical protein
LRRGRVDRNAERIFVLDVGRPLFVQIIELGRIDTVELVEATA